jgi:hypothetical protein
MQHGPRNLADDLRVAHDAAKAAIPDRLGTVDAGRLTFKLIFPDVEPAALKKAYDEAGVTYDDSLRVVVPYNRAPDPEAPLQVMLGVLRERGWKVEVHRAIG